MKRVIRNVAASVRERLLNRARTEGEEFNLILRRYFFERFLYRLGASTVSERFILKGAMLLQLWAEQPYRATIDLDLLRKGDTDRESLTRDLREVMKTAVPDDDGVLFDPDSIAVDDIRIEDEYSGVRVHFVARLGTARHLLQVDIGFGDSAWPPPKRADYPSILGSTAPKILTYARETVIAEKLEAMVLLGIRNSRIKDFFDVQYLASTFPFDGTVLAEAIRRTFRRRKTVIPTQIPVAITEEYWSDSRRGTQLRAFARRARLDIDAGSVDSMLPLLRDFLWPPLEALAHGANFAQAWRPGGPWKIRRRSS